MNALLEARIRKRAYEIWEARQFYGRMHRVNRAGRLVEVTAQDDWLLAEAEVFDEIHEKGI